MRKKIMTSVIAASLMISSVSVTWPAQVEAERAEITYGVNFRTSPSVTDNKIRMLKKGENVTILKKANEHWYQDRKSTRLNSSHVAISYAVFCLKKKKTQ